MSFSQHNVEKSKINFHLKKNIFSVVVDNLSPDQTYDFRVVAVDGRFETPSKIQEVYTYSSSTLPRFELDESRSRNVSHSGWFIGKY